MVFSYDDVCEYFKKFDCEMLTKKDDYKNSKTKVEWKCKCGIVSKTTFSSYKDSKTHLCKKCGYEKRKDTTIEKYGVENVGQLKKYSYDDVKKYYEEQGCKLISETYNNAHDILKYKCKCGNINESRYCDFKNKNSRCYDCGKEARKKTNLERFNTENAAQNEEVRQKMKQTNLDRYGVEFYSQTDECKQKIIQTNLKRYGVEFYSQTDECKERVKNTNLELYGFEIVSQNREILNKILIQRTKDYKLPSGKNIKLDGYEHFALDILLKKYNEKELITNLLKVPAIVYSHDTKKCVYYPDIYIPKKNKIIEVKGEYFFNLRKAKNMAKKEACLKAGYKFEFWIFDKNGKRIKV